MRLMRLAVLKRSHILNVEIHRVFRAMLSPTDGHVCLMDLRSSVGEIFASVAGLFSSLASAGKRTNADTVSGTPGTSTPNAAASVVDLLRSILASIVEKRRTVAAAKTGWRLKSSEKKMSFGGSNIAAIGE